MTDHHQPGNAHASEFGDGETELVPLEIPETAGAAEPETLESFLENGPLGVYLNVLRDGLARIERSVGTARTPMETDIQNSRIAAIERQIEFTKQFGEKVFIIYQYPTPERDDEVVLRAHLAMAQDIILDVHKPDEQKHVELGQLRALDQVFLAHLESLRS